MKFIAHRGNTAGPDESRENKPDYIDNAISLGFDVEVDVWLVEDYLCLGHDGPETLIDRTFLETRKDKLWCHAKNLEALEWLVQNHFHCFFHDKDAYVITSHQIIWAYPGETITNNTICVMPERVKNYSDQDLRMSLGICSDFVEMYKNNLFDV